VAASGADAHVPACGSFAKLADLPPSDRGEAIVDRKGLRSPKVGLALLTFDGITPEGMPRWSDLKAMAQCAEAVGFDSLWVPDHLMCAHPATGEARLAVWECWSVLAALAAATSDIELGTLWLVRAASGAAAKMADTVDDQQRPAYLSASAQGWTAEEFRSLRLSV
jgi:hypothetical protein